LAQALFHAMRADPAAKRRGSLGYLFSGSATSHYVPTIDELPGVILTHVDVRLA
jgi:hypothetical protein